MAQWPSARPMRLIGTIAPTPNVRTDPAPFFVFARRQTLRNTPVISLRMALDRGWSLPSGDNLMPRGSVKYAGRTWVGGGPLHLAQGGYTQVDMGLAWTHRPVTLTLDVFNLFDAVGNRFALGNPLAYAQRTQWTPLQPRTVRIDAAWSF